MDPRNLPWGMIQMVFQYFDANVSNMFFSFDVKMFFWPENMIHAWKRFFDVKTLTTYKFLRVKIFLD